MDEFYSRDRRGRTPGIGVSLLALLFTLMVALALPAQTPPAGSAGDEVKPFGFCGPGDCCPPSTQQKIIIGAGTLVLFVVLFLLLVRVVQRFFIQRDWSATLGRHTGILVTIAVSSGGMLSLADLITGCFHPQFFVWLGFAIASLVVYSLYMLIVVRNA